jgi:hypothetical protein
MKLALSLKFEKFVGIYGFIESKSKHVVFYVVVHAHFMGMGMYGILSGKYIHRDLILIYWLTCGNLLVTLCPVYCSASCCTNAGSVIQNLY